MCLDSNNNPNLFQICKNVTKIENVLFVFWFSSLYFLLKYVIGQCLKSGSNLINDKIVNEK